MKLVELLRDHSGQTRIGSSSNCRPGVYRIQPFEELVFLWGISQGHDTLDIVDINEGLVASLVGNRRLGSPQWETRAWSVGVPGPYNLRLRNSKLSNFVAGSFHNFFDPPSTIIVSRPRTFTAMLTVMPRRLGCVSEWLEAIERLAKGYDAIHFTPCQPSGPSHSSFSIADVLDVDPLLFSEKTVEKEERWKILRSTLEKIPKMVKITDVVFNHASSTDSWACSCPEATYSLRYCQYLTGAADLDSQLLEFSNSHSDFLQMRSEAELFACMQQIRRLLEKFNFHAYCQLDLHKSVEAWRRREASGAGPTDPRSGYEQALTQVGIGREYGIVVNLSSPDEVSLWRELSGIKQFLDALARECFSSALQACENTLRFERLEQGKIDQPLLPRYFSRLTDGDLAANNGWVMNWPAGIDFAAPGHHLVYMKRHVVAWGDCLKLRYSDEKIWEVMESYCGKIAQTFDGIRLDNCHSTPVHVLRRLVGSLRRIKPEIIIMAELFTGEANNDAVYESTLGIDVLVKEGMQIRRSCMELLGKLWDCSETGIADPLTSKCWTDGLIVPQKSIPILYDCTHDNSTPNCNFGNFNEALPLAVAVASVPSAIGSAVGFDILRTSMPSVVTDPGQHMRSRLHREDFPTDPICEFTVWIRSSQGDKCAELFGDFDNWSAPIMLERGNGIWYLPKAKEATLNLVRGKSRIKFLINKCVWLVNHAIGVSNEEEENNIYDSFGSLAELKSEFLLNLHKSLSIENYTAFFAKVHHSNHVIEVKRMRPDGACYVFLIRFGFAGSSDLDSESESEIEIESEFESIITAVSLVSINASADSDMVDSLTLLRFPGKLVHFNDSLRPQVLEKNDGFSVAANVPRFGFVLIKTKPSPVMEKLNAFPTPDFSDLQNPTDFSYIFFCCDSEEPTYQVPGKGKLFFAGLAGFGFEIQSFNNDQSAFLASPLAENIRKGDWLFDFCMHRFVDRFEKLHRWMKQIRPLYVSLPSGMKPRFFYDLIFSKLFINLYEVWRQSFVPVSYRYSACVSSLFEKLIWASFQFTARSTVAAGLPFFASGFMRCWGRDTFIAFTGLFLVTRRFAEARKCLIDFAAVVKHGLIPNLYDDGNNPRYNSRDATWCFLHAACNYIDRSGDMDILCASVEMRSEISDRRKINFRKVIELILCAHWEGIDFVEDNAGPQIDQYMQWTGFNVRVWVDSDAGLVVGGNEFNCGTWMDKMGSSSSNRGIPATSRHGANIEINGLVLRVLNWVIKHSVFPNRPEFLHWRDLLQKSFDSAFWNPSSQLFNDTILGDPKGTKLRPNGLFALSVVPKSAVNEDHARKYLSLCEESLRGPLGIRTLSASDPDYNGFYDNSDFSGGYNYHNGPEWVWLFGYFVIACRRFDCILKSDLLAFLETHYEHIRSDAWRSLPELTNMNGQVCSFSCPSQAWSVCCLLEALEFLETSVD